MIYDLLLLLLLLTVLTRFSEAQYSNPFDAVELPTGYFLKLKIKTMQVYYTKPISSSSALKSSCHLLAK